MQITTEMNKAAGSIVDLIANRIGEKREIHPATAISAGARLAGSFLFRSFNLQLNNASPGTAVLSEQANEKGPVLIGILGSVLESFGVNPDPGKMKSTSKAESNLNFMEIIDRLQNPAQELMNQYSLGQEQMAYCCAMATAFIIKECQGQLPVESGFHTAVYGFIEGSKTYPPDLSVSQPKKKSIFKFWK